MPQRVARRRFERRDGTGARLVPDDHELEAIGAPGVATRAPVGGKQHLPPTAAAIDVHRTVSTDTGERACPADADRREAASRAPWLGRAIPVEEGDAAVPPEHIGSIRSLNRQRRHSPYPRERAGRAV